MKKICITVLACVSLCAGLLSSCASFPQNAVTSQTVQESWGTKTIYKDASGDVVRIERRGPDNHFLPGACVSQISYDNGERVAKQNLTSQGIVACNSNGYAITKYLYLPAPGEQPVVEERFYDQNNEPVVTKSGYAMMTCTKNSSGQISTIHFSDFMSKPAPSVWYGVSNVVDVQYSYLQGITPIVCGVFWGPDGKIIDRKQLKGLTVAVQQDDDSDYDVPVYIYTGGSDHDHDHDHDNDFHGGHH